MLADFGASAARESERATDTSYFMAHSAQAFLVDDKGRLLAMYPFGIGWDALAADLKTIL
jgi:cytochrome oxidase Cu insertion factor (SCO1/SenC/PrrC family)